MGSFESSPGDSNVQPLIQTSATIGPCDSKCGPLQQHQDHLGACWKGSVSEVRSAESQSTLNKIPGDSVHFTLSGPVLEHFPLQIWLQVDHVQEVSHDYMHQLVIKYLLLNKPVLSACMRDFIGCS